MSFIAKHIDTGERINILEMDRDFLSTYPQGKLVCPMCGGLVIPRSGHTRNGYIQVRTCFAHASACTSTCRHHRESWEHDEGKKYIANEWLQQYGRYKDATIEHEVVIEEVDRRVDVMVTLPNGHRIAHEIQLSAITPHELKERTDDYLSVGIDVYWHIGKSAYTDGNCAYLADVFGEYNVISVMRSQPRVERQTTHTVYPTPSQVS